MQVPVVIETIGEGQFRAKSFPPFTAVAEGKTTEEAISKVRAELNKEVEAGKSVVMVEIGTQKENPWLAIAGSLQDNPLVDEWKAAMEEYRHQCDVEAGIDLNERQ
jgi:hypothetical protein